MTMQRSRVCVCRGTALVLVAGLACSAAFAQGAPAAPPKAASASAAKAVQPDLPIHRVTLYRSGVGFFERSGTVDDNADVQLRFETGQINDILKSLVLLDLDGGQIQSVSYGSKEPLAKRLASFGLNISDDPSVPDLLKQLRGAKVKVFVSGAEIVGTVLGVEQRASQPSKGTPSVLLPYLNLVTSTGLRSVAVAEVSSFEIMDKKLADELNKALAALAEYRADRTKTVDLHFAGSGARRVVVGYVLEMPVWKASYRLVLPEAGSDDTNGKVQVQGWAIVENTTDHDWNNVQLSLVSGRPVSFQMDLYQPLFATRPDVPVPMVPGVGPRVFETGTQRSDKEKAAAKGSARWYGALRNELAEAAPVPAAAGQAMDGKKDSGGIPQLNLSEALGGRAAAEAATVGEVFQYEVNTPVTIERQRSAMIPIISASIPGKRVSIFNANDGTQFPMRGVQITNDSNFQFLPGPISVFDGSTYAGDAEIGQIPKNDKRLLAYAIDLDVHVITKPENDSTVMKVSIVDGLIRQTVKSVQKMVYEFDNKDAQHGRTIILEQTKLTGYELVGTEKPSEETQDLYRFNFPIASGKATKFSVEQDQTRYDSIGVLSFDLGTAITFHQAGKLSDNVLNALKQVAAKQSAINETQRQIAEYDRQSSSIDTDQRRIRENMGRIDHGSDLYKRYMGKLTDQETQLEDLKDKRDKAQAQLVAEQNDLNDFIRGLNVE